MLRPHIVILGGGFGGVYVAKRLAKLVKSGRADVTLVNKTNNFLFTPLLHEVATGGLQPRTVAEPLREIFVRTNVRIVQGEAESIDMAQRSVFIKGHSHSVTIDYDYLVIATGAETNYYGIPGAAELSIPLKSLHDASRIRNRIIDAFEQAVITPDSQERSRILSFAVVGGGATGVELAAELADFVRGMVGRYYGSTHCRPEDERRCEPEEASIVLVHAGHEILEQFTPRLRTAAADRLAANGIEVRADTAVTSVSKDGLATAEGMIPASVVIWTAGVKAHIPHFEGASPEMIGGRLAVDRNFLLKGSDRVYAIGDAAGYAYPPHAPDARPLPQLAQVAVASSKTVARNIISSICGKPLKELRFRSKGSLVSVGQWFAVGDVFTMHISGRFTWALWRAVYLSKFASWKKRIRIAIEWALQMFFPRDITKIP